jgi:hypothetical protein
MLVLPLRKKNGLAAAPVVNLVPISLVYATSVGADLIILSSDTEDEVDRVALVTEDEVGWEALVAEDNNNVEYMGSGSPTRSYRWLRCTVVSPHFDVGVTPRLLWVILRSTWSHNLLVLHTILVSTQLV